MGVIPRIRRDGDALYPGNGFWLVREQRVMGVRDIYV